MIVVACAAVHTESHLSDQETPCSSILNKRATGWPCTRPNWFDARITFNLISNLTLNTYDGITLLQVQRVSSSNLERLETMTSVYIDMMVHTVWYAV